MFGQRLANLRKDHNLTQKDLADVLECSPSRIGMYEQGRRSPNLETLETLADYFNVSTDSLIGRNSSPLVPIIKEFDESYNIKTSLEPAIEYIKNKLKKENLIQANETLTEDDIMLFVRFGENAAIEMIKNRIHQKKQSV